MANPPVPALPPRASATPSQASLRRQRRRLALLTDIAVIAAVALFVVGAVVVGLVQLHAGLSGR